MQKEQYCLHFPYCGVPQPLPKKQRLIRSMHNDAPDSVRHALDVIGRIYTDNYDSYVKDVYPRVRQQLSSRIGIISERLGENNIIDNWERVLDKEWKHGDYRFLLFRAGERGPSFRGCI